MNFSNSTFTSQSMSNSSNQINDSTRFPNNGALSSAPSSYNNHAGVGNNGNNNNSNNNLAVPKQTMGLQRIRMAQGNVQPSSSEGKQVRTSASINKDASGGNTSPNTRMQNEVERTNEMATEWLKSVVFRGGNASNNPTGPKSDGPPKSSLLLQHRNAIINDNGGNATVAGGDSTSTSSQSSIETDEKKK